MNNRFEEKTISSDVLFEGKIISLRVEEVELPDGKQAKRELVGHPGAVAIIPITEDGKLVLVEQYRKALNRSIIEIPAGKIEPGEDIEVTALRELEEETGYGANHFNYIQSFATSPGFANEIIHIFVAKGLYKIEKPAMGDEDEFINIIECTLEEAEQMVIDERIYDAKTAFGILYAKILLNK
ncbi:NUDIX hydrolase [Sporosarcina thermotolerans]|uniref:NUDIX hydrolase n=1 Tax=Sporosarcina thermotolerans TaxID=633404 RepID=A0AAW9A7B1_9BACL|nr:NUDIX hydrolase [Sporosarcina thermotolerans]MDW0115618.1 NUDIX hydrolase [Sporosarcina thermotolerans]WHT47089.1 NUDIX hydrolase [Sporosarcina thermotolerans]